MARRTKEEALATRHRLLDAAELLFQAQGVSQTSLQQIAAAGRRHARRHLLALQGQGRPVQRDDGPRHPAAGGRGAHGGRPPASRPAGRDRARAWSTRCSLMTTDPQVRRVFDVATHKVEYTARHGVGAAAPPGQRATPAWPISRRRCGWPRAARRIRLPMPGAGGGAGAACADQRADPELAARPRRPSTWCRPGGARSGSIWRGSASTGRACAPIAHEPKRRRLIGDNREAPVHAGTPLSLYFNG